MTPVRMGVWLAVAWLGLGAGAARGGTFIPAAVVDQTPTAPLQDPTPATYQPRYVSGFGSNDSFTVVFEDRDATQAISFATTTTGPSGFPVSVTSCGITDTHFCVKAWPIEINGTNYEYRGWGSVGNNPQHHFYVAKTLTEWTLISTFTISNAVGYNPDEYVYYGFHDVLLINGTYYAWGEGNGGGTLVVRSPTGKDDWEAFSRVGGNAPSDGPLYMIESPTPSGSFVDLGYNRGLGKVQVRGNDSGYYLAINTACRANLSPAEYEAAFTNVNNWTWNNGTTGAVTNTTALLTATAEHDVRECWVVPQSNPDDPWVIVYDADYGAGDGGKALGYATLTPPEPGPVHNVTKDLYYDTIPAGIADADEWDFIQVGPGSFGPFVLNKRLTIEGSGSTANPAVSTVVTGGLAGIQLYVGGTSATDRVEVSGLYLTGAAGVPVNQGSAVWVRGTADVVHVTFSNVTFAGNQSCGLAVDMSYAFGDIVFRDCVFESNGVYGIRLPTRLDSWDLVIEGCLFTNNAGAGMLSYGSLSNITIRNSTFVGNASGADQLAEIVLSPFNGDAEFSGLVFVGNNADAAIRLTGTNVAKEASLPAGHVTFSNVTVQGTYSHAALQISRYTTADAISFSDVELPAVSPVGLHLGTVNGTLDIGAITFNGVNSQGNIVLGKHGAGYASPDLAYSNALVAVDATGAVFTGAAGNWDIEDRIVHGPDIGGLGTVTWIVGQVFVTPDSGSVGRGVEASSPGDTVIVAPGTYTEHVAGVISHSMTVRSEGGDCGSGVVVTGTNGIFRIADGVSGVTIQGFSFQGVTGDDCISAAAPATGQNNVTIISNCFENIEYAAVDAESNAGPNNRTNWLVTANFVDGVTGYPNSGFRFMVLQDSVIANNTLLDIAYNGMTLEALVDVDITGNLISNTYACGIQVANNSAPGGTPFCSTNVLLAANTILLANTNNAADKGAIAVYPDVGGLLASGNLLSGNNNGFTIRDKTNALSAGVQLRFNNIHGNSGYGAANFAQGGGTLDAVSNWWGSYAGPGETDAGGRTGDAVSTNVDYVPWTYGRYGSNHDGDGLEDPYDPDDDNDTYTDVDEVVAGSDPLHVGSVPTARVSGTASYSGSQTGTVYVYVLFNGFYVGFSRATLAAPGPYSVTNVPRDSTCAVWAYRDSNGNNSYEPWEASGTNAGGEFFLTNDVEGVDVTLEDDVTVDTDGDDLPDYDEVYTYGTDPDDPDTDGDLAEDGDEVAAGTDPLDPASFPATIAGDVTYSGAQTGTIYVVVSNTTLARTQLLAAPGPYAFTNLPTLSNYWIRAFRDSSGNGAQDTWEASGAFAGNPLLLTNDEDSADVALTDPTTDTDHDGLTDYEEIYLHHTDPYDDDTDDDLMPDGWEVDHLLNPLVDDAADDAEGDFVPNLQEYRLNLDPQDLDSDDDGFEDGEEVLELETDGSDPDDPVVADDDGPADPLPGDPALSDPAEDGSLAHPYDAIQEALDEATNGMMVLVLDGTYTSTGNSDLRPGGKAIVIRSYHGSASTLIEDTFKGFICDAGETSNTVIQGFSIHMWSAFFGEEGIVCDGSSPRLVDCRVWDCLVGLLLTNGAAPVVERCAFESCADGGARVSGSSAWFDRSTFVSNAAARGAGLLVEGESPVVMVNCLVADNQASDEGGGVLLGAGSVLTNIHCTIAGNDAVNRGGGLSSQSTAYHTFRNTVLYGNTAFEYAGFCNNGAISFQYCCLQRTYPGVGNTTSNPAFAGSGDYRLTAGSAAIDSGTPVYDPGIDLPGNPRPLDGDTNGAARADMGAYEFAHPRGDTDGDGMFDPWEMDHDLDPTNAQDAAYDGDGDGDPNLREHGADTDPWNDGSWFRLEDVARSNSCAVLFACTNSRRYSLEGSTNLPAGSWYAIPGLTNIPGDVAGFMALEDTNSAPAQLYRVGVSLP